MNKFIFKYWPYISLLLIVLLGLFFRIYRLDSYTVLNADEAALGYNAWSLWLTGKDEFGHSWPLVFQSFNDYKPGVYVYLSLPFIAVMGLTSWAVRMPGLVMSLVSIGMMYPLTRVILGDRYSWNRLAGLAAALLLAITPWHIHFSRGAWETQMATSFLIIGTYCLLKGLDRFHWKLAGVILYVLAMYTYHSMRVVIPLMGLAYMVLYWSYHVKNWKRSLMLIVVGLMCLVPLGLQLTSETGLSRAAGVSIWADSGPVWRVNELRSMYAVPTPLWVKLLNNKWTAYGQKFMGNYALHFDIRYLFFEGDEIQRNRVPEFGQLLLVTLPLLPLGMVQLFRVPVEHRWWLVVWLLVAPIPAALTFQSPHAVRSFSMVVPLTIIIALGVTSLLRWGWNQSRMLGCGVLIILLITLAWDVQRYWFNYYYLLQAWYPYATQYGVRELVAYLDEEKDDYDEIYVTTAYDQPYILSLFYSQYPPEAFQTEARLTPRDEFGYSTVAHYNKFYFRPISLDSIPVDDGKRILVAGTPEEMESLTEV